MILAVAIVAGVVFAILHVVADRRKNRSLSFVSALGTTAAAIGLWAWQGGLDIAWVAGLFLPFVVVVVLSALTNLSRSDRRDRPEFSDKGRLLRWVVAGVGGLVAWVVVTGVVFGFGEAEIPLWWSAILLAVMTVYWTAIIAAFMYHRQRRHKGVDSAATQ